MDRADEKLAIRIVGGLLRRRPAEDVSRAQVLALSPTDWIETFSIAQNNRCLLAMLYAVRDLGIHLPPEISRVAERILTEGETWITRLHSTLGAVAAGLRWERSQGLIIKTLVNPQDVTFDVDVMVPSTSPNPILDPEAFRLATKTDESYEYYPKSPDFLPVDVYVNSMFRRRTLVDYNFLSKGRRIVQVGNDELVAPSREGEFLLRLIQMRFQNGFITLGDIVTLQWCCEGEFNWERLSDHATEKGWFREYREAVGISNGILNSVLGESLGGCPWQPSDRWLRNVRLPRLLPLPSMLSLVHDRRPISNVGYLGYAFLSLYLRNRLPVYEPWFTLPSPVRAPKGGSV